MKLNMNPEWQFATFKDFSSCEDLYKHVKPAVVWKSEDKSLRYVIERYSTNSFSPELIEKYGFKYRYKGTLERRIGIDALNNEQWIEVDFPLESKNNIKEFLAEIATLWNFPDDVVIKETEEEE